jgi:hypothetical protein
VTFEPRERMIWLFVLLHAFENGTTSGRPVERESRHALAPVRAAT